MPEYSIGRLDTPESTSLDDAIRRLFLIHLLWDRHHGQGREDAVDGIEFHRPGGKPPLPNGTVAHRPREVGRIDAGERSVDEPGHLPIGRKRETHAVAQQWDLFDRSRFP